MVFTLLSISCSTLSQSHEIASNSAVNRINRKLAVGSKPKHLPSRVDNERKPKDEQKCVNINLSNSLFNPPGLGVPPATNFSSAQSHVQTGLHYKMPGPAAPKRHKSGRSSTLTKQDVIDLSKVTNPGGNGIETLPDILVAPGVMGNTTVISAAHAYRTKPDGLDDDNILPDVRLAPLGMPNTNGANFNNYRMQADYPDVYLSPRKDSYTNTWLTSNFAMKRPLEGDAVHGVFVHPPATLDYIVPARLPTQQAVATAHIDHQVNINHDLIAQNIRIQVEVTGRRNILSEFPLLPAPDLPPIPLPTKQPSVQEISDNFTAPHPVETTPSVEVDPLDDMASEVVGIMLQWVQ